MSWLPAVGWRTSRGLLSQCSGQRGFDRSHSTLPGATHVRSAGSMNFHVMVRTSASFFISCNSFVCSSALYLRRRNSCCCPIHHLEFLSSDESTQLASYKRFGRQITSAETAFSADFC
ncbi:hypothetical protein EVAR_38046_1 [Eumeta japonica]|uniref:Uncharacterized protein n=1 Tax=Eumeta variegata TaxID=151549 RepID=A0A4C1W9U4_EUMVA|nr:hypothetical protein EVAR_38046_1 [Eumeta japonica]